MTVESCRAVRAAPGTRATAILAAVLGVVVPATVGSAPTGPQPLRVTLPQQQLLPQNAHTSIPVTVQLPAPATRTGRTRDSHSDPERRPETAEEVDSADMPLLLTPHIEGAAVELVRGRLLRSDGKQLDASHLRFEVPVVARSVGTSILRVDVRTYTCDPQCRPVQDSATAILEVR